MEEITEPARLAALVPEWRDLVARAPDASPFQTPDWLLAWTQTFLEGGLWTLAFRRDGRLAALAPLFVHRRGDGGRQLTLIGNGVSDHLDLIAEPGIAASAASAVFRHLDRRRERWDAYDFRDLPAASPLLAAPLADGARIEPETPCPALELPADPALVMGRLPKARRTDLRRCARRLAELAPLRFERASHANAGEALATVMALHERRWAEKGEAGVFARPGVRAFHEAAAPGLQAAGLLRLYLLHLGERPIAGHYGFRRGDTACSYIHAFDPAFARFGPGWLLMAHVHAEAVREGARRFDFLRGPEAYKYDWGAVDQPQFRRRTL